jgi:predicted N-acetyltransferase YhbS
MAALIRKAQAQDAGEIARLASQLGYPTTEVQTSPRLKRLLASSNDLVLVAESAEGAVIGWIHGFLSQLLESDFRVEIGGLIVDEKFHRQGVGRELVQRIEAWAKESDATQVSVRCRITRLESHKFYENLGFSAAKTQIAFRKQLPTR